MANERHRERSPRTALAHQAGADLYDQIALHRGRGHGHRVSGYVADVPAGSQAATRGERGWWPMGVDSPDVVIAKRLIDHAKLRGFAFRRAAPGQDGPLVGKRAGGAWVDIIHIAGFSRGCLAVRQRTSSLILVGNGLVERRVEGSALDVLNEVLTWEPPP